MNTSSTKVVIVGGHLTPAIATIQALKLLGAQVSFIGRHFSDSHRSLSHEQSEISSLGVNFYPIHAAKFHRKPLYLNFFETLNFPGGIVQSTRILKELSPHVVLSFGGYLAIPVALSARSLNIPFLTHEQTTSLGLANRFVSSFATKLAFSWPGTVPKSNKNILTGNPVRQEFSVKQSRPSWYKTKSKLPLLYITGGNQGSRTINRHIATNLRPLLSKYLVIHQTGSARDQADYQLLTKTKQALPKKLATRYFPHTWLSAQEVAWIMKHSRLVISRSGANSVSELLVTNTPSILIPLPVSGSNEQHTNATLLSDLTSSYLLDQKNLPALLTIIDYQLSQKTQKPMAPALRLTKLHQNAATKLARLTLSCAQKTSD